MTNANIKQCPICGAALVVYKTEQKNNNTLTIRHKKCSQAGCRYRTKTEEQAQKFDIPQIFY